MSKSQLARLSVQVPEIKALQLRNARLTAGNARLTAGIERIAASVEFVAPACDKKIKPGLDRIAVELRELLK